MQVFEPVIVITINFTILVAKILPMNEAILKHLARTEALLEAIVSSNAMLFAKTLEKTPEEAERHYFTVINKREAEIFARLIDELGK